MDYCERGVKPVLRFSADNYYHKPPHIPYLKKNELPRFLTGYCKTCNLFKGKESCGRLSRGKSEI